MFSSRPGNDMVVYVDGSCINNGYSNASAGIGIYWGRADELSETLPGNVQTNQRAELYAVIRALETCPYPRMRLEIRTDSKYAIGCATEWIYKWRQNNFQNCKGYTIANADLVERIDDLLQERVPRVTFVHVSGHSGDSGNDAADDLARGAAEYRAQNTYPSCSYSSYSDSDSDDSDWY